MSKMLKKVLVLLIVTMLFSAVLIPTVNKTMASELDLNSILDDDNEVLDDPLDEPAEDPDPIDTNTNSDDNRELTDKDNKVENTSEEDIPKTGLTEDITVMFFIGVCVITSIFAYKKSAEYRF